MLYDHLGRPVKMQQLTKELADPEITSVRTVWNESVANGLTPATLADVLLQVDQGDAISFLTLAQEMEERELHYAAVLSTRKRAVSGLDAMVEAASDDSHDVELADAVRELIVETDAFDAMLPGALDAIGKGYSVTEIMWKRGDPYVPISYKWRDPRFFIFDLNTGDELRMRDEENVAEGVELAPYKFIVHRPQIKMGLTIRNGLARLACVAFMLKGYSLKDWWAFMEVFGIPWRIGKYSPSATAAQKAALLAAIRDMGSDAACMIPEGMLVEIVEASRTAGGDKLFLNACDWLDRQVSKAVLGQVATTEGTPGRLGNEDAQENVREDIRLDDAKQLSATIRRDLIKPFVDLNWGPQKRYPRFRLVVDAPEDLKLLSESLPPFIDRGLRVQSSVILDKFGIPEAEDESDVLQPKAGGPSPRSPSPAPEVEPEEEEEMQREQSSALAAVWKRVRRGEAVSPEERQLLVAGMALAAERQSTTVQTLVLSKEVFKSLEAAKKWVTDHDFHATKVDETDNSYRFRQRDPKDFKPNSFRTITMTEGVKAVIGKLKTATAAEEHQIPIDEIDRLALEEIDGWRVVMDPVFKPLLEHADASGSYQEFLDGLEGVLARMDSTEFAERVATLTLIARGRGDATDEM